MAKQFDLISIYIPHTSLYITVMVTLEGLVTNFYIYLHCFVVKCHIQMLKNVHGVK